MLKVINPHTGQCIAEHKSLSKVELAETIAKVHAPFEEWQKKTYSERAEVLKRVAKQLRDEKAMLATLMAEEMGKPIKEGGPEVEKAAWCAEHYAEHVEQYLATEVLASDASKSYVQYQPLGTVLGILPWNAPLWLAFRFLAPALMAGNTCVLKHDPNVPGCAQAIEDIFTRANAPQNIMANLPLSNDLIESAIRDPLISAVSFTGSSRSGAIVASVAASEIKPAVLELGGSDPFIVFADADLEKAADIATLSRIINAGQSCIAAKRILVESSIYGDFCSMLEQRLAKLKLGDPMQESTDIGPIARADLRDNLHRQVTTTIEAGAKCLLGGELPSGEGFHYPATLLTDVTPEMCAYKEETFGPVAVVSQFSSDDQALEMANDTDYGLGAGVWTENAERIQRFINEVNAGQVAVNGIVKTDPRLPSGGIKKSGYGRELGPHGIKEFVNAKQVWIR